jgi:hypothetical protein
MIWCDYDTTTYDMARNILVYSQLAIAGIIITLRPGIDSGGVDGSSSDVYVCQPFPTASSLFTL